MPDAFIKRANKFFLKFLDIFIIKYEEKLMFITIEDFIGMRRIRLTTRIARFVMAKARDNNDALPGTYYHEHPQEETDHIYKY